MFFFQIQARKGRKDRPIWWEGSWLVWSRRPCWPRGHLPEEIVGESAVQLLTLTLAPMSNVHPWKPDTNENLQMYMTVGSLKCKCLLFSQYFCSEGRDPFKKYTWQKSLHLKFPHRICFKVFPFQHRPITWEGVPNQTLGWAGSFTNCYCYYYFARSRATWCLSFFWRPMNPNFVYFKSEE